jgi:hypothetical protein
MSGFGQERIFCTIGWMSALTAKADNQSSSWDSEPAHAPHQGLCGGRHARLFGLALSFPSAARFYQALTFYPALTYGVDSDRIDGANLRIVGVGNRGLSGIVYRIKVACVRSKQGRHNAWGARFGKIADAEFHARKIVR